MNHTCVRQPKTNAKIPACANENGTSPVCAHAYLPKLFCMSRAWGAGLGSWATKG